MRIVIVETISVPKFRREFLNKCYIYVKNILKLKRQEFFVFLRH